MNETTTGRKNLGPGLILGLMALVVVFVIVLGGLFLFGSKTADAPKPQTAVQTTAAPILGAANVEDAGWELNEDGSLALIETPYGVLQYSAQWKDYLMVRHNADTTHTVSFYAMLEGKEPQHLFDVFFGKMAPSAAGVVRTDSGLVSRVGIQVYSFEPDDSWSKGEADVVFSMQEAVNDMLALLTVESAPVSEFLTIETPYVQLRYPAERAAYLKVVSEGSDSMEFYGQLPGMDPVLLFRMGFGSGEGAVVGSVADESGNAVDVRFRMEELNFGADVPEEAQNLLYSMQEDVNSMLEQLNEG